MLIHHSFFTKTSVDSFKQINQDIIAPLCTSRLRSRG
jgi:hypothetical protein